MFASKLPHTLAIYQLPEQSCRFIPTLSGRIFMKLVKKGSNFTHPLMIKKKKRIWLLPLIYCVGFSFVHSEEDRRHCGGKNLLLNLAEKHRRIRMGGKQCDTLRSDNVIMAIRRHIVLVCKAAVAHNRQHSSPTSVMSRVNRAFKMSF